MLRVRSECNWSAVGSAILDWTTVGSSIGVWSVVGSWVGVWNATSSDLLLLLVVFLVPSFQLKVQVQFLSTSFSLGLGA